MKEPSRLIRHSIPHKYDIAPCGTECIVITRNGNQELYKQISGNEDNPVWEYLGTISGIKNAAS